MGLPKKTARLPFWGQAPCGCPVGDGWATVPGPAAWYNFRWRFGEVVMGAQFILSEYVDEALSQANYDKLEDGTFAGRIPSCKGVVAFGATLRECEDELRSTQEDWILVGLKLGHSLPVIGGIDLYGEPQREPVGSARGGHWRPLHSRAPIASGELLPGGQSLRNRLRCTRLVVAKWRSGPRHPMAAALSGSDMA